MTELRRTRRSSASAPLQPEGVTLLPPRRAAARRAFSRTSRSPSVMRPVSWRVSGRSRTVLASPDGMCTPRWRAHGLGGPAGDREPGTVLGARVCPDEGFYLHRRGSAGVCSRITSAAVHGRSSGPMQPAAGISALSTETICGPKLRLQRCPSPRSRHGETRIIAGQQRWRWDLNPRKGCPLTRFRVLRTTVHHRPLASLTSADRQPRSPVNGPGQE